MEDAFVGVGRLRAEVAVAFCLFGALGRRLSHDASHWGLLFLEEHQIDGSLEPFGKGDALGLRADYQVAA